MHTWQISSWVSASGICGTNLAAINCVSFCVFFLLCSLENRNMVFRHSRCYIQHPCVSIDIIINCTLTPSGVCLFSTFDVSSFPYRTLRRILWHIFVNFSIWELKIDNRTADSCVFTMRRHIRSIITLLPIVEHTYVMTRDMSPVICHRLPL